MVMETDLSPAQVYLLKDLCDLRKRGGASQAVTGKENLLAAHDLEQRGLIDELYSGTWEHPRVSDHG